MGIPVSTSPLLRFIAPLACAATLAAACAPAAPQPAPTAPQPAKPAATSAPAKAEAKPAPTTAPPKAESKPPQPTTAAKSEQKAAPQPAAKPADNFFAGKTVHIITGYTPGGLYDGWSRLLAKHMPKHISGNPNMVVENMAGAASLKAANHVYNAAPKDGTVIGSFSQAMILNQIKEIEGLELHMQKFQWLGAVTDVTSACLTRDETGIKTLGDMVPPSNKQLIAGTSGPGSTGYDYPLLMKATTDANFKIVSGYPGNNEVRLGIEKGELDGYCVPWEVLKPTLQPWIEAGQPKFTLFVQVPVEGKKHPEMPNVPVIWDYVKQNEDKQLFKLLMAPEQFFWPFTLPPGVPAERVQTLRKAMADAFKDPQLIADAEKAKWTMNPVSGEQIQKLLGEVLETPQPIKAKFKEIMTAQP